MKNGLILFYLFLTSIQSLDAKQIYLSKEGIPLTSFNITFRVGSVDDPRSRLGIARLVGSLIRSGGVREFKKRPALSREEFDRALEKIGATISTTVTKEQTSFSATVHADNSAVFFNLIEQMILAPAFSEKEFSRIKEDQLQELSAQLPLEDQEELGKDVLEWVTWGDSHPYAHPISGYVKTVSKVEKEDVESFYKKYFTAKRLTVGVSGKISATLRERLQNLEKFLPAGDSDKTKIPNTSQSELSKIYFVEGSFPATGIHLGHALSFTRANAGIFDDLYLFSVAFGKHRAFVGELMNVVREERGINYGTYSYVENFLYGGSNLLPPTQNARSKQAFSIWARPAQNENACFLMKLLTKQLQTVLSTGLNKDRFELAKKHLTGNARLMGMGLERELGYAIDDSFYGISNFLGRLKNSASGANNSVVSKKVQKEISFSKMNVVIVLEKAAQFLENIKSERCEIHYAPGIVKSDLIKNEDQIIANTKVTFNFDLVQILKSKDFYAGAYFLE